jgi:hypothetical protein
MVVTGSSARTMRVSAPSGKVSSELIFACVLLGNDLISMTSPPVMWLFTRDSPELWFFVEINSGQLNRARGKTSRAACARAASEAPRNPSRPRSPPPPRRPLPSPVRRRRCRRWRPHLDVDDEGQEGSAVNPSSRGRVDDMAAQVETRACGGGAVERRRRHTAARRCGGRGGAHDPVAAQFPI